MNKNEVMTAEALKYSERHEDVSDALSKHLVKSVFIDGWQAHEAMNEKRAVEFAEWLPKNGYGITEYGDWFFDQTPIDVMNETKESIFNLFKSQLLPNKPRE
jgi:hypothetical protein